MPTEGCYIVIMVWSVTTLICVGLLVAAALS